MHSSTALNSFQYNTSFVELLCFQATIFQVPIPSAPEKLDIEGQKPVDSPSIPSVLKPVSNDSTRADFDLVDMGPKGAISSLTSPVPSAKAEQRDLAVVPSQFLQSEEAKSDQGSESKLELEVAESADLPASYFDNLDFEEQPRTEKRKQTTKQDRYAF